MDDSDRCFRVIKPSQEPVLREGMNRHAQALEEAGRRLLIDKGFFTDAQSPDAVETLLARYAGEVHPDLGLSHEPPVAFEEVVALDMSHPEFLAFKKEVYGLRNRSAGRDIISTIGLFRPDVAPSLADNAGVELNTSLFVIRPFRSFEKPSHLPVFVQRMVSRLKENRGTNVRTAWLFEPGQLAGLQLADPAESFRFSEFRHPWRM